ncbi:SpoIIE family protein phosphatase [Streptomyces sp. NPDC001156]
MAVDRNGEGQTSPHADARLLQQVMAALSAGVYILDDKSHVIWVNPRAENLLVRSAADMIGHDSHDLLHRGPGGGTLPRHACRLLGAFLSGTTAHSDEWFERGDGAVIHVACLSVPYRTQDGTNGGAVIFYEHPPREAPAAEPSDAAAELSDVIGRLTLVAEITTVLTSTLDSHETLRRLVRLLLPQLGDWAVVDLLDESGEVQRVAVVHHHHGTHVNAEEFEGSMPPASETENMPLARVLRGALPMIVSPADYEGSLDTGIAVQQRDLIRATGIRSAVIAPLYGLGGVVLGALTVGRAEQPQPYGPAELTLVDDIARRAGLAVDNARLYEQQRRIAATMQRHLLPPLPRIPGLEMAARYEPAPHASQVGGDWYDAFLLPDGATTALVIGDVAGHDLQAAARMAQIRNMLRAFAWDHEAPPSRIVDRLDQALVHVSDVVMASLILARLEGAAGGPWTLRWTNAGHPPPLLVHHDRRTKFLEEANGVVIGTELATERIDAFVTIPPLSTLVFYTDGLIESPSHTLDQGLKALSKHAAALAHRPLDDFCDSLVSRSRPADNDDDIALLALHIPGG